MHDIVRFARSQGHSLPGARLGRQFGALLSASGITEVDPVNHDLLFERFISADRNEPPDIDVDFEHERREEVMQYIYDALRPRPGRPDRHRHHLSRPLGDPRGRQGLRPFGRSRSRALTSTIWGHGSGAHRRRARRAASGSIPASRPWRWRFGSPASSPAFRAICRSIPAASSSPATRLDEVVPIMNAAMEERTTIEWDKDDLDALGILKIDVLALGMLTCLRKGFDLLDKHYGQTLTLATICRPRKPASTR